MTSPLAQCTSFFACSTDGALLPVALFGLSLTAFCVWAFNVANFSFNIANLCTFVMAFVFVPASGGTSDPASLREIPVAAPNEIIASAAMDVVGSLDGA